MKMKCEEKVVRDLYETTTDEAKKILETIFGKSAFNVWCYDKASNELIKPEDWTSNNVSGGVVVVSEEHSFRVLPHYNVSLQWGDSDMDTELCQDMNIKSGKDLTDRIIETYKGVEYKDDDNDYEDDNGRFNFIGSPAAEFCKSVGGYLPSVVELKIIAENVKEINKCMMAMGQPTLPMDWYWSSVESENRAFAQAVDLNDCKNGMIFKRHSQSVRAVSSFDIK